MIGDDAFDGEMEMIRAITEDEELAVFARTLRAELLRAPTGATAVAMPVRLADVARGAPGGGVKLRPSENGGRSHARRNGAGPHAARNGTGPHAARRRLGRRFGRPLVRLAAAVVAIPALFTGLAFAGVELPDPASDAFESVGIELPNQSADDDAGTGTSGDGGSAGSKTGQESSAGEPAGGQAESSPAGGDGRTVGNQAEEQKEGGAVSDPGLAPETPDAPGGHEQAAGQPVSPPAGPPESPGNSSGNAPDGAGPGAGDAGVMGPFFAPDEGSPPEPAKP